MVSLAWGSERKQNRDLYSNKFEPGGLMWVCHIPASYRNTSHTLGDRIFACLIESPHNYWTLLAGSCVMINAVSFLWIHPGILSTPASW